jgi:hypothetical protein
MSWSVVMFLHKLGSSDSRFRTLVFQDGMNILLADRTSESTMGESRNGAGKTSFVKLLRYLLGGSLDASLKNVDLRDHTFNASIIVGDSPTMIERPISPMTTITVDGSSWRIEEWKARLGTEAFSLPPEVAKPTVGQLAGQLVRTYFQDAIKTFPRETSIDSGTRIGYLLGFSPEVLDKAVEVAALKKHRQELRNVIKSGALPSLSLEDAELRARLAQARARRQHLRDDLAAFKVDEQYSDHQREADDLSAQLRILNESALALRRRQTEIEQVTEAEQPTLFMESAPVAPETRLRELYDEVGLLLPDTVTRRFDEVAEFHASVIRNRQFFLRSELESTKSQLRSVEEEIHRVDAERAKVMDLLEQSMALETFRAAEADLSRLENSIADLEQRLKQAEALAEGQLRLKAMSLQAETALRAERSERASLLDDAMALFSRLGEEIYDDRSVSLLIEPTKEGVLKVVPKIDGDASTGISEVKIFLLDIVCLISAIRIGRAPRLLVHDSLLYDSMDDRQVASCLNIGARLADEHGFQYIVTMNSDRLESIAQEGFDRRDYIIDPVLTDKGESGGLFGFRFV